jgi:hypothetical protein
VSAGDPIDLRPGAEAPEALVDRLRTALARSAALVEQAQDDGLREAARSTRARSARLREDAAAARAGVEADRNLIHELQDLVANLQVALVTRATIDQAKGILMAAQGCTPDEAFDLLRRASQRENRKLHDVAADIVARTIQRHAQGERGSGDGGDRVEGSGGAGELHDPGDLRRGADEGRPT